MTREEAKKIFLNRGFIDGIYNGDKWREACIVISEWLEQEPIPKNDLGVDCIVDVLGSYTDLDIPYKREIAENILTKLHLVTPQEPRWIPVSEYLPVTNDEVLVTYIVNGNAKKRYVETANCYDGEWSSVNDEYRIPNTKIEIIAWCEMPKPYSEVEE